MIYLLDVAPLIALLWKSHEHHERVKRWLARVEVATCPLTELGFLRISTQPVFGLTVEQARATFAEWKRVHTSRFIPCDLPVLDTQAPHSGSRTTDFYMAGLAAKHGMQLATLD